jgi:tRNA pseudouridine38-40 synthase
MRNIKMIVAYVGTRFAGWQVQPGQETIQGNLEERISSMLKESVRIAGAGRTDAGVHARGQVANFHTTCRIPLDGFRRGLNAHLPEAIRVIRAEEAAADFHARERARAKEYRYRLARGEVVSPFEAPYVTAVHGRLDVRAMDEAARRLVGRHDFHSFCAAGCDIEDKTRTILESGMVEDGDYLEYRVRANGFLRHMVRTIVGTLLDVGHDRRRPADIEGILEARDRRAAGACAPARGLVLEKVFYEEGP